VSSSTYLDQALALPGARIRENGKLQVRLPNRWKARPSSLIADADEAGASKAIGWFHEKQQQHERGASMRPTVDGAMTLGEVADAYLEHRKLRGSENGEEYAPKSVDWLDRSTRPWREGAYSKTPVCALDALAVETSLLRRGKKAPRAAKNEREQLMGVLRHAQRLGLDVPAQMLAIATVPQPDPKPLRSLEVCEVPLVVESAPAYSQRHVAFLITSALRINESFEAVDDWLDEETGILHVPKWATKERRAKDVVLSVDEQKLVAANRLARPAGCRYLFPKAGGGKWQYKHFDKLVWQKIRKRAAARSRELGVGDPDKLATLRIHELRATGCSFMVRAGVPLPVAAARVGHNDGGVLLGRRYATTPAAEQRKALDALEADGLLAALGGTAPGGSTSRPTPSPSVALADASNVVPLARKVTGA
jgi:integrase